jgi:hypothetical protein
MATLVIDDQTTLGPRLQLRPRGPATATATWPVVRIETEGASYVGQLFVPETKRRLTDVLADSRPFVHLVNVTINGGSESEPFIALNKRFIRTVRIVDEGKASEFELVPLNR